MTKQIPTEAQEQQLLIQWLKIKKIFYFAPMNENQASFTNRRVAMIQEAKAKSMGKVKGTCDLFVFTKNGLLGVELKRRPKRLKSGKFSVSHTKTSKEQIQFIDAMNGYDFAHSKVCYGFENAKAFIEEFI